MTTSPLVGRKHPPDCAHCVAVRANIRHGHSRSRTYKSWAMMWNRCTNPKCNRWQIYGGRGITVCDRWRDFVNFLADMGERPVGTSLDRIDNDGNYTPDNCRYATISEQNKNRRTWKRKTQ